MVIEGIDGSGKSTLCRRLRDALVGLGEEVVLSREPTDGPHGRRLRATAAGGRLPAAAEVELFEADRREHVATLIEPALREGKVILLDRYYFSTAAYQGARGLDWREILARNEAFAPKPDLVMFLDLPLGEARRRIGVRGAGEDAFERAEYQARVQAIFREMSAVGGVVIPAGGSADEVFGLAWEAVRRVVGRGGRSG